MWREFKGGLWTLRSHNGIALATARLLTELPNLKGFRPKQIELLEKTASLSDSEIDDLLFHLEMNRRKINL